MGPRDPQKQQLFQQGVIAFQSDKLPGTGRAIESFRRGIRQNAAVNTIVSYKVTDLSYFADYWQRVQVAFGNMILPKAGKA
jgi:hypothetical protein